MKKIFVFGLLATLVITGCQTELEVENNDEQKEIAQELSKVFTAVVDDDFSGDTKTSMDDSGNVLWKSGDQVSIFAASTVNEQYQVTDASVGKTSAALNRVGSPGFVAGTEIDNNVAFYPYSSTADLFKSGGSYVIRGIALPSTQTYAAGSFGNGAFPMAAVTSTTSDYNLKFKNVLGGLKLQPKGTATITSITVTGNNNEILCGDAEVTVSNSSTPSISLSAASAKTVTLDCGAGVTLDTETAIPFIIALPPMTMTGGFTVTVTDSEGKQMEIKTTKSQIINRSSMLRMPAVNYFGTSPMAVPEAVDLGLSVKWASCNLGASSPSDYGDYYAWGEIDLKDNYDLSNYKWFIGSSQSITKYNNDASHGTVDNKIILDSEDDVAHVKLGGNWRMPTADEIDELLNTDNCSREWTQVNGIDGWKFTSKKSGYEGNFIFLPAAGDRGFSEYDLLGTRGIYWSSSLLTNDPYSAWDLGFGSSDIGRYYHGNGRYRGRTVRAVEGEPIIKVTSVSINKTSLNLIVGGIETLRAAIAPNNAANYVASQIWTTSDDSVVTVADGVITAVSEGTATITAIAGGYSSTCTVRVTSVPEAVDLGLSVKWASCNLGASTPEEYGDRYAWGEIATKDYYDWSNYKWCDGSYTSMTKYCTSSYYGVVDNLTVLEEEDDVARVKLSGSWRMPTVEEATELYENCTWVSETLNGVDGFRVTGQNSNSIFIPLNGQFDEGGIAYAGTYFYLWLNQCDGGSQGYVLGLSGVSTNNHRHDGLGIRAVYK